MVAPDARYAFPRDLVGYGEDGFQVQWPNDARIAVSFCVNYEEGAEMTVLNGDSHSETWNWEKPGGRPVRGARHTNVESDYEYGSRSGIWRLMRIFKRFGYCFTCFAVGKALEINPDVARACTRDGHELAGHGYRWLDRRDWKPEEEKLDVKRCIEAIQHTAGLAPVGWFTGRGSPNSVGVVWEAFREMGLDLKWEADAFNDDVPYWVHVPMEDETQDAKGLLILPYAYDTNDMKFVQPCSFGGNTFEQYLTETFDMLYAEGGKMMSLGLHPRLTGKPGRAWALQNFLQYISRKPGVWVATRREIAEHISGMHPTTRGRDLRSLT